MILAKVGNDMGGGMKSINDDISSIKVLNIITRTMMMETKSMTSALAGESQFKFPSQSKRKSQSQKSINSNFDDLFSFLSYRSSTLWRSKTQIPSFCFKYLNIENDSHCGSQLMIKSFSDYVDL